MSFKNGFLANHALEQFHQLRKFHRMRIAKVEYLEWNSVNGAGLVIDRCHYPGCDIINPRIVPSRRTVAKNGHGLACLNQRGELMYGQIWALPGPINSEEAEANHIECKKMRVGVAK